MLLNRRYGVPLKDAWDTSFGELLMLSREEEKTKTGGVRMDRAWLERLKSEHGVK